MGFLSEYDAAPDPQTKAGILIKWLRADWRGMYAELRSNRPILMSPQFTMVTRATDVIDILSQPTLFSVKANRRAMDPSVGPFMLARDETELNWQEKGLMQVVLRRDDVARVRALAGEVTEAGLQESGGEIDIVPTIARKVPLRIVQEIFGFRAPDDQMLRWSFASQHGMFRNLPFSDEVLARCHDAGEQMRAWLWPFLAAKWAAAPLPGSDAVERLINLSRLPDAGMLPERVLTNVCGLLVGAIETTSQAIVQATQQLVAYPERLAAALTADAQGDQAGFDAHVFEALRFNPITTIQFRLAESAKVLGVGTTYATRVEAGTVLAVCTGSAMFDPDLMPDPDKFDVSRPPASYLHFGLGHHECLGRHVGRVAIPEAVRRIVRKPGIRAAAGDAGQIDFAAGPFPEHWRVEWDTADSVVSEC